MANPFPTPGQPYIVQVGDTLTAIAVRAYGTDRKWVNIYRASATAIKSGDPNKLSPGEVLFIPVDVEKVAEASKLPQTNPYGSKDPLALTLNLDGLEVPVTSARVQLSLDSIADEFTCELPWIPGADPILDAKVRRFAYTPCKIYLGSKLVLAGRVYNVKNRLASSARSKTLNGNSTVADVIDSTSPGPYFLADCYMDTIAREITRPFGVTCTFQSGPGLYMNYFEWKDTDTVGNVLTRLAAQSGQLVGADEYGNLTFGIPNINTAPVATLTEGDPYVTDWEGQFDGRARFNLYTALGQTGDAESVWSTAKDSAVPTARRMTFVSEDLDTGGIVKAATWRRSKQVADSIKVDLPVAGWYAPDGTLWWPGDIVTVKSATLEIPNGARMLITSVEFEYTASGASAILHLDVPESLTGGDIPGGW